MEQETPRRLIVWALGIFFLFIFGYFAFTVLFPGATRSALGIERFLPVVPDNELTTGETRRGALINLQNNLADDMTSYIDKTQCLIPLTDTSVLNDYEGYSIEIANYQNKVKLRIFKEVGDEGGLRLEPTTTEQEIQACSINPETFYNCYLKDENRNCATQVYNTFDTAALTGNNLLISGISNNYFNYLFKPEPNKACFIPFDNVGSGGEAARFGLSRCDASFDALDNDCAEDIQRTISPCGKISSNIHLCALLYSCAREENVDILPPLDYCNQNNFAVKFDDVDKCHKVSSCITRARAQDDKIPLQNTCRLDDGEWMLSFTANVG